MNRRIIALPILVLGLAAPALAAGKKAPAQWKGSITVTGKHSVDAGNGKVLSHEHESPAAEKKETESKASEKKGSELK